MKIIGANVTGSFILNGVDVTTTIQSSSIWSGSVASSIVSINSTTASLNTATSSLNAYTASASNRLSSIELTTGSLNTASGSAITRLSALEVTSGSNITRLSSLETASGSAITRLTALETATGSFNSSIGSLNATTASLNTTTSSLNSSVTALNATTSSLLSFTASQASLNSAFATTSSNTFNGNQTLSGSLLTSGSITATGTITAQTLVVQTVTSSVSFITGSTKFGSLDINSHQFTGSVSVTGSLSSTSLTGSIAYSNLTGVPSGIVSGSSQISYTGLSSIPSGIVSGSSQVTGIGNAQLTNSTISGISLGSNLATLTIGTGLSGTSYNGSGAVTIANTITNNNQLTNGAGYITSAGTAAAINQTISAGSEGNLVFATIGTNDFFRIRAGGGSNAGFAEIATADDGTEPIYVRQYTGEFASLTRTATLLDGSGNTSFPGSLSATNLSGTNTGDQTNISGNAATATKFASGQTNWVSTGIIDSVVGLMAWKNYGNSHVIFDASAGTSPSGGGVNQTNATTPWSSTYPTLMGWNGSGTYGVRVDSARIADSTSGNAATVTNGVYTNTANTLTGGQLIINGGQSAASTAAYTSFNTITFNDDFSNVARGPNKIITYGRATSWVGGIGIHDATQAYYAGDTHKFYKFDGTTATLNLSLDGSGNLTATGNVTAYSDKRIKENIKTIDNALSKVLQLRGVTYNRTDLEDKSEQIGIIAQEIQEILPQVVNEENDRLSVAYGNLAGVFIEAIKEQQSQIEELKTIINGLTK